IDLLKTDFPVFLLDSYDYDMELWEYAEEVYENNNFGYGENKDGIFLVVDYQNSRYGIYYFGNADKNVPYLRQQSFLDETGTLIGDGGSYEIFMQYLDSVFALAKEWNVDKADKPDGMPYWYPDDVDAFQDYHAENPERVVDNAGILTAEQKETLTKKVQNICDKYDFGYVIFTDDSTYGLSKEVYSADFLYFGGYGKGDDFSSVCFFLSLEEGNRGWRTTSTNSYENIFTENVTYTIDELVDSDIRAGRYYEAFLKQADYIERNLEKAYGAEDGIEVNLDDIVFETVHRKSPFVANFFGWPIIVGIIIAMVIAGMVIAGMKKKMVLSTAVSANEYLQKGSLNIRNKAVNHLYTTITRTRKSEKSSGGGSSYSSGSSSSGGSYSSGGRDF
ncbi:MAG: TPM domain-containing protein, partial [Clostridia bacterium]|nr:TPM domain-containing protein [Clostridia bacterium]